MSLSFKRPRLSLFSQNSSGAELDHARFNNDMTLKGRFESIFAKYSQDFTGIGDEIDLSTGRLIVNNGHLESMEAETDSGIDRLSNDFTSTGRSMLRAMTTTLHPDFPGPDDVLMSIEIIAENAALSENLSLDGSEDKLFDTAVESSCSRSNSDRLATEIDSSHQDMEPYDSDYDSLFAGEDDRADSPDSLFAETSLNERTKISSENPKASSISFPSRQPYANDNEDIIARFGPHIGKEVIDLIGRRNDAHIEPLWRIPIQLQLPKSRRSTPEMLSSSISDKSPMMENNLGSRGNKSLWELPKARSKRRREKSSFPEMHREESLDPLQEGFEGDVVRGDLSAQDNGDSDSDYESTSASEDEIIGSLIAGIAETGECPYCYGNYKKKSGVMAHWDRWLRQTDKRKRDNDPHDLELIGKIRSNVLTRRRFPRLVVYDFRTMVELHEGAGLSFDEVVETKTLRTHKSGLQLQEIYNQYRIPSQWDERGNENVQWSKEEEATLFELCKNPLATMASLCRGLKGRDESQIGNHLAEFWLNQLRSAREEGRDPANVNQDRAQVLSPNTVTRWRKHPAGTAEEYSAIKEEEQSEDELFR